jgi:hypothetical protein
LANALAYYDAEKNYSRKSFIVQVSGVIKIIWVINPFYFLDIKFYKIYFALSFGPVAPLLGFKTDSPSSYKVSAGAQN